MRRVSCIILFILGGWLLLGEAMVAWMDMGMGTLAQIFSLSFVLVFAVILLGLGTLICPGNRPVELGLTLMIVAGITAVSGLMTLLALNDPQVAKMMPPDQPLPEIALNPLLGAGNLLLIAGAGYALWRKGRAHLRSKKEELERVFGD